jgi:hypothetical protein
MIERFGARTIALAVLGVVLLVVIVGGVSMCSKLRNLGAQNRTTEGQLGAAKDSASDAIATTGNTAAGERASEDLTRTNEKEIRNAEGASQSVNPGVRDAGIRSLCRRPSYRNDPRCKLLDAPAR